MAPDTTVQRAIQILDGLNIACLPIAKKERPVGVFTNRDVLDKMKDPAVRDFTTPNPPVIYETDNPATSLSAMATRGMCHVLILDVNSKILCVIGPKWMTALLERHFAEADDGA